MMFDALAAKLFWEQTQEADIRTKKDEKLSQNSLNFKESWTKSTRPFNGLNSNFKSRLWYQSYTKCANSWFPNLVQASKDSFLHGAVLAGKLVGCWLVSLNENTLNSSIFLMFLLCLGWVL